MKVSVAMAVYNGMNYLAAQLSSLLPQLGDEDELIVSCDPSSDGSEEFLSAIAANDSRVRVFPGPGCGVVANFEAAIAQTRGDVIFLCDQDDLWLPGKVERVCAAFQEKNVVLILHDAQIINAVGEITAPSFFRWRGVKKGYGANLLRNSYIGCCMAFRASLKERILPIPPEAPMHDQWIGLLGEKTGEVVFLAEPLLSYRRHGSNLSADHHSGFFQMLSWRRQLWRALRRRLAP